MRKLWHRVLAVGASGLVAAGMVTVVSGAGPAAAATKTINIGFECSCSGPQSSSTAVAKPGVEAWQDQINAEGGIDGSHVNVIYNDDGANTGTGLAQVETLVAQDHVVAIIDAAASDVGWATYAQQHGVPVLGGGESQIYLTNNDFFADGETIDEYFTNFVDAARKVGAKALSELYCAESVVCQEAVAPFEATAKKMKMPVVYVTQVSFSAPNYTAQCLAAKQAGAQALIVADAVAVVSSVMNDCAQQGYTPWEISLDGAVDASFPKEPGLENHFIGAEPDMPFFLHNSATSAYDSAIDKYEPSVLKNPDYGEEVVQYYAAGAIIAAAAKAAKAGENGSPITAAEIKNGLFDLHGETLNGLTPPITYHKGSTGTPVDCWYWIQTEHGKLIAPYGTAPDCVKPTPIS